MSYIFNGHQLSDYQTPDSGNPLSWGAVRENIEQASNRDFLKRVGGNAGMFTKIQNMFLKRPSLSARPVERPGLNKNGIERPGFLSGF